VAEKRLEPSSAFLHWERLANASFSAEPRKDLAIASVAARQGKADALAAAVRATYGIELPTRPARVEGRGMAFVWSGPGQWLAVAPRDPDRDLETELAAELAGLASVVDQSDGRIVVRIWGPRARDVLAKGIPIDLHPRAFKAGGAAITHVSHISVVLWQLDETPAYELALFRSYADSFAHWLADSAAEYAA